MFSCPNYPDSTVPCPCGCASADQCYIQACKAVSTAIRNAPRDQLNAVYVTGMASLGQSPEESARYTRPVIDHGAGEGG